MSTEVVEEFDADYTGRHFLSVEDMSSDDVMRIIERGRQFKAGDAPRVEPGHVAINMFFENSTRTMTSFQMAEHRLGMKILDFDPGHSSVTKGESLYDSVRTVDALAPRLPSYVTPPTTTTITCSQPGCSACRSSMVGMDLVNTLVSACWTS